MDIYVFKRYEYKYKINREIYEKILPYLEEKLDRDKYFSTTIQSMYFDTDNYRLIRRSIESPLYKEKLRLRCYNLNQDDGKVFLEIKKKYDGVVYKRRIKINESKAIDYLSGKEYDNSTSKQISKEIKYINNYYGNLSPKALIIYDRYSFYDNESKVRVTFDHNIRYRLNDLNLSTSLDGDNLVSADVMIMEIKSGLSMPFWLARLLSEFKIYKQSFSKYKEVYKKILEDLDGKNIRISAIK